MTLAESAEPFRSQLSIQIANKEAYIKQLIAYIEETKLTELTNWQQVASLRAVVMELQDNLNMLNSRFRSVTESQVRNIKHTLNGDQAALAYLGQQENFKKDVIKDLANFGLFFSIQSGKIQPLEVGSVSQSQIVEDGVVREPRIGETYLQAIEKCQENIRLAEVRLANAQAEFKRLIALAANTNDLELEEFSCISFCR